MLAKRDALKASCLSRVVQFEIEENSLQRQIVEERAMVQKRKRFKPIDWSLIEVPSTETVRKLARGAKSSDKTKPASWGPQQQKGDQVPLVVSELWWRQRLRSGQLLPAGLLARSVRPPYVSPFC